MWFKQAFFRLVDWAAIDRNLKRPLNDFRATLGLPPVDRVLHKWVHSPQCVICFFPEWFAARQPDWPPRAHLVGFPLWDGGGGAPGDTGVLCDTGSSAISVPAEAEEFLNAGEPPVVFTPGSAAATMQRFFAESVETALSLDVRAMLITNFQEQLPRDLPRNVKAFGYVPFSEVLPRAALLVYHGGIGTLAQTIRAGIPHLVVPSGHDQFDNAWRIEQLGLGLSVPQARYRSDRAARAIRSILADPRMIGQSRQYAAKTDSAAAVTRACELVEGLAPHPTK
jgi:rhamnosyltransferase subunit B